MELSSKGLRLIAQFEACVWETYPDGDNMAWGFGHNDPELRPHMKISFKDAITLLREDIKSRVADVNKLLKVSVTQGQFDAFVSLYYQKGNTYAPIAADAMNDAATGLAASMWPYFARNAKREWKKGLRDRRLREQKVFLTDDYGDVSWFQVWHHGPVNRPPDEIYHPREDEF